MKYTHTHPYIKSRMLRQVYARELWEARPLLRVMPICERLALRLWLESGIWAVQKRMMFGWTSTKDWYTIPPPAEKAG